MVENIHWFSCINSELHHTFLVYAKIPERNLSRSEQRKSVDARGTCYLSLQHTGVQAASGAGLFSSAHGYVFYQHTLELLIGISWQRLLRPAKKAMMFESSQNTAQGERILVAHSNAYQQK